MLNEIGVIFGNLFRFLKPTKQDLQKNLLNDIQELNRQISIIKDLISLIKTSRLGLQKEYIRKLLKPQYNQLNILKEQRAHKLEELKIISENN